MNNRGAAPSASVSPPSVQNLYVPPRPTFPGHYATFSAEDFRSPFDVQRLTFTYERLRVIAVRDYRQIPIAIKRQAYTFGLEKSEHRRTYARMEHSKPADPRRTLQGIFEESSDAQKDLVAAALGKFDSAVFPVATGGSTETSRSTVQQAHDSLTPYIIYGDVDVDCGTLVEEDAASATAVLNNQFLALLKLDMYQAGPRGPPSPEFMMSLGKDKLTRTIYVVGHIKSFHGPDQHHRSFMKTFVVDLGGASEAALKKFKIEDDHWQKETESLASKYMVSVDSLRAFAGLKVDVYSGKVDRSPTDKERREIEETYRREMDRKDEESRRDQRMRERERSERR